MGLLTMEHSPWAYRLDFVLYTAAVLLLGGFLGAMTQGPLAWSVAGFSLLGVALWSPLEYGLHRFVLHGLPPFKRWHQAHHAKPVAPICSPTLLSAGAMLLFCYLPAWWALGAWRASGLTLGVLVGYLFYAVIHHALHHWRAPSPWLRRRKSAHAYHHHSHTPGHYGVTTGVWDQIWGTAHLNKEIP